MDRGTPVSEFKAVLQSGSNGSVLIDNFILMEFCESRLPLAMAIKRTINSNCRVVEYNPDYCFLKEKRNSFRLLKFLEI